MRAIKFPKTAIACAVAAAALTGRAYAFESFQIRDIRAEGLQRLEIGTVLTYLPLAVGDELNTASSRQAIRALYGSGLFQVVQFEHWAYPIDFDGGYTRVIPLGGVSLAEVPPELVIRIPRDACQFYEFWRAKELIEIGREEAEKALDKAGY